MRLRSVNRIALLLVAMLIVTACATAQLTPDQQARVALDRAQQQLNTWWNAAGAYYSQKPTDTTWKSVIVPAFDVANRALRNAAVGLQTGNITPDKVQVFVQKTLDDLMAILVRQGVLK